MRGARGIATERVAAPESATRTTPGTSRPDRPRDSGVGETFFGRNLVFGLHCCGSDRLARSLEAKPIFRVRGFAACAFGSATHSVAAVARGRSTVVVVSRRKKKKKNPSRSPLALADPAPPLSAGPRHRPRRSRATTLGGPAPSPSASSRHRPRRSCTATLGELAPPLSASSLHHSRRARDIALGELAPPLSASSRHRPRRARAIALGGPVAFAATEPSRRSQRPSRRLCRRRHLGFSPGLARCGGATPSLALKVHGGCA